jgi:hypothetical protein
MSKNKGLMTLIAFALAAVLGITLAQPSSAKPAAGADSNSHAAKLVPEAAGDVSCAQSTSCTLPPFDFNDAFDVHVYTVFLGANATNLTVDTMDCCIAGDHWGVVMNRFGGSGTPVASAVGNGSITAWTGAATLTGTWMKGRVVQVTVFHAAGVSAFPAGLDVRFRSNAPIQQVTQRLGQG